MLIVPPLPLIIPLLSVRVLATTRSVEQWSLLQVPPTTTRSRRLKLLVTCNVQTWSLKSCYASLYGHLGQGQLDGPLPNCSTLDNIRLVSLRWDESVLWMVLLSDLFLYWCQVGYVDLIKMHFVLQSTRSTFNLFQSKWQSISKLCLPYQFKILEIIYKMRCCRAVMHALV